MSIDSMVVTDSLNIIIIDTSDRLHAHHARIRREAWYEQRSFPATNFWEEKCLTLHTELATARNGAVNGRRQWAYLCKWQPVHDYAKFTRENRCDIGVPIARALINARFLCWAFFFSRGGKPHFSARFSCHSTKRRSERSRFSSRSDNEVSLTTFWAGKLEKVCTKAI